MADHESRLDRELRHLLHATPVATLGTVADDGSPQLSLVPYTPLDLGGRGVLLLHVSGLAAHTRQLRRNPRAALLVHAPAGDAGTALAVPRVAIDVAVQEIASGDPRLGACRAAHGARYAQAALTLDLPDFAFFALQPLAARHVAGFGAARDVSGDGLERAITLGP